MFQNLIPSTRDKIQNSNGFTLLEILITIAIFTIIIGIVVVATKSLSDTVNLDNSGKIIGTNIKLAKMRSINSLNDTNYGVRFENDKVTVFAGSLFDASDVTNKVVDLSDDVEIYNISLNGGGIDLVFDRLTGATNNFGVVEIRLIKYPAETKQVVINQEGQISYNSFQTSSGSPITNARHVHYDMGWSIENSTILRFERIDSFGVPTVNDIDATAYFNADESEFDWSGETIVGSSQTIKVRGWFDLSGTELCVILDQTESDILNIYFVYEGTTKKITTYANVGGIINVTPDFIYGGTMDIK